MLQHVNKLTIAALLQKFGRKPPVVVERLQLVFSVPPYAKNIRRAYTQDEKWYFMDWRAASNALFENYVAAALFRAATLYTDRYGDKMSLHFVRTHDGTAPSHARCWLQYRLPAATRNRVVDKIR